MSTSLSNGLPQEFAVVKGMLGALLAGNVLPEAASREEWRIEEGRRGGQGRKDREDREDREGREEVEGREGGSPLTR